MMNNKTFLACGSGGITRATCQTNGEWTVDHVIKNQNVECLVSDPSNPETMFAGTRNGIIRSDDCGITWRQSGMDGHIIKSLAVSPHDSDTVYAGSKPATLFITKDGGDSWEELEGFRRIPNRWWWFSPADPPDRRPYIMSFAISPTEPNVLLAGVEFGAVVRSEDSGRTWSRHRKGALRDCHSLKFHTTNGQWVYQAGGTGGGASFSRDGGHVFQKAKRGLAKNYGIVCAADPGKPEIWYVVVAPSPFNAFGQNPEIYLYRQDGGAGWHPIGWEPHPMSAAPTALVTLPESPGHLYAGLPNGDVWYTTDYGDAWEKLPFNLKSIWFSLLVI